MRKLYPILSVLLLAIAWSPVVFGQSVYYVNSSSNGANNGTSWANAFTTVQSALDAAISGDQIWVAAGTYNPSKDIDGNISPTDSRTKTFLLKNGVRMYGGFAGTEILPDDRTKSSMANNPTILTGDFNGNDGASFTNYGDNAYHVLVASGLTAGTVLDGFIVKGGNAVTSGEFLGVSSGAEMGAGMFINNTGEHLTIRNCVFSSNSADIYAGGILMNTSSPKFVNCVIENNRSGFGGGLHLLGSFPTFINTVFAKNNASYGGAMLNNSASNPTFFNCTFFANSGTSQGGAMTNFNGSSAKLTNCIVWGNTSADGPAFYSSGGTVTATYSNIQGGYAGTGNINTDPIFSGPIDLDGVDNKWMTPDDGLTLREISPSANAGLDTGLPAGVVEDITGDDRIQSVVNMGAYEKLTPSLTVYVNASSSGANNGTSWANAFMSLQSALDVAVSGDQIFVAAGTYAASKDIDGNASPADVRTKTFLLKNGVKMFGGFAGTEASPGDRTKFSIADNPTILSGDFSGNDGSNFTNYSDNAYHILVANGLTSATVLDGFVVKSGNAVTSGAFLGVSSGAGMGAGMFINNSGTHLTIHNCVFSSNSSNIYAGGILINSSSPNLLNCVIENNKSGFGGGMHLLGSFPTFVNTVFANNSASYGGALLNNSASNPLFINCTFFKNNGTTQGGAITNFNGSSANLKNCIVWANTSADGPAFYSSGGTVTVTYSNVQGGYVGTGNINTDPIFSGTYDLDGADSKWMTADDGLTLRAISASANAGHNEDVPTAVIEDITGDDRIQSVVNMGAYEKVTPSATLYVNASAIGTNNGSSWTNAFTSLQSALDVAVSGDQIWVAGGIYVPTKDITGNASPADVRTKTFFLKNGVKMFGGFAGVESNLSDRTKSSIANNPTILSGDFDTNDAANFGNYSDNAYHVLVANALTSTTLLDGFIVKGGNAVTSGDFLGVSSGAEMGAGMFVNNSGTHLAIYNCVFTSNSTDIYAGGILINSSSPTLFNCVIENNRSGFGGGLHLLSSFPTFINAVFANNSASYGGAMLNNSASNPLFINCTFFGNNGTSQGGAITNFNGSGANLKNCIVWGNTSADGPAFYSSGGTTTVTYSNVQGGYTGTGNIDTDPLFNNTMDLDGADDKWMTADDGLAFLSPSPSANTGNNADVATIDWDIVGDMRILDSDVNMGAYESLGKTTPSVTWASPSEIVYGTALNLTQLNASANMSGTMAYFTDATKMQNAFGAILPAGKHSLYAVFTPDDTYDYNSMQAIVSIEVQQALITVTANAIEKTYGDADPVFTYSVTNGSVVNGDVFSGSLGRIAGEDAGTYTIDQNTLVLSSNYVLTYVSNSLTINQRPITVTAEAKSKAYGDIDPDLTYSITSGSLAGSDSFSGSMERIAGEEPGDYSINQNTLSLSTNYTLTYVSKNFTITKRAITVTADPKWKEYGEADPELTYSITSGSLLPLDAFTGSLQRTTGETPGEYTINQNTLTLDSYYDLSYITANLTIDKRAITVTADAKQKTFGETDPALTYTITSGTVVEGDEFSGAIQREVGENAGSYAINQSTLGLNENYDLTFVSKTFTIAPRPITVSAEAVSKVYGDADPGLSYSITSGSLKDGDAFVGSMARTPGEEAGTYNISQNTLALNANYEVTFVPGTFTIQLREITVTADAASKTYGDDDPALGYSITSGALVDGDAFTGSLNRISNENAGTYEINQNTLALNGNYALIFVSNTFTIQPRQITVTVHAASKTYGDADPVLTYSVTSGSLVNGDNFTGTIERESGENVGSYSITQNTLALNSNYELNYVSNILTITQRPVTVTAVDKSKQYGDADPVLTYSITSGSLVNGDEFTGSLQRAAGENAGLYEVNQNTLALNANYDMTFISKTFIIVPREITVTAEAKIKQYGDADPALGYFISSGSLVSGDEFIGSISRVAGENVNSYGIVQNTLSLGSNYNLTFVPSTFTITPRAITVTAEGAAKTFGNVDPSLSYLITSGSLLDGDAFTGSIAREPGENAGSYAIVQNTLALDSRYEITFVSANFTIHKAMQEIFFAELQDVVFGDEPFTLTAETSSGLAITYSSSDPTVATVDGSTLTIVGKGTAVITATQPGDSNYLSAVAVERTMTVKGAIAEVDQASLLFAEVLLNREEVKAVTLTNSGNADLRISNVSYPPGYNGDVALNTTVAPGASLTIQITFSPTEVRAYPGTIELTVNTPEGTVMIETSGEGINVTSAEVDLNQTVIASPNPAKDVLNIKVASSKDVATIRIHDIKGAPVNVSFEKISADSYVAKVNSLPAGVYFVTIHDGEQIVIKRFVKL